MNRRAPLALAGLAFSACAGAPALREGQPTLEQVLQGRPRILWVAAHPDDEAMAGALLAKSCLDLELFCHFLVLSRGEGGECCLPEGCRPDLATVRQAELARAARLYRAGLEHHSFSNSPLPVESFPTRPELERRWMGEGDPAGLVARAIRRLEADLVLTLDPEHGFTGHPEHQAAARFALAGARIAADPSSGNPLVAGLAPHRVSHLYQILNRYWFLRIFGVQDPGPHHEEFDGDQECGRGGGGAARSCLEVMVENTRAHRSQERDMNGARRAARLASVLYLRHVDPFGPEAAAWTQELEPGR
jgi:LmbE family N-acetylglucosaminyl deacetylase